MSNDYKKIPLSTASIMKPTHKNIEKIEECLINKPLQEGNLLYITKTNNS